MNVWFILCTILVTILLCGEWNPCQLDNLLTPYRRIPEVFSIKMLARVPMPWEHLQPHFTLTLLSSVLWQKKWPPRGYHNNSYVPLVCVTAIESISNYLSRTRVDRIFPLYLQHRCALQNLPATTVLPIPNLLTFMSMCLWTTFFHYGLYKHECIQCCY